jgi:hypothetical protein
LGLLDGKPPATHPSHSGREVAQRRLVGLHADARRGAQVNRAAPLDGGFVREERRFIGELAAVERRRAAEPIDQRRLADRDFGQQAIGQAAD